MPRKKPEKPEPKKKPAEKPPVTWTTDEAIERLFPRPAIDAVRDRLGLDDESNDQPIPKG